MPDLDITDAHAYPFTSRERALAALGGGAPEGEAEDEAAAEDSLSDAFDALLESRGTDVVRVNAAVHVPWGPYQARIDAIPRDDPNPIAREEEAVADYVEAIGERNEAAVAEAARREGLAVSCGVDPARMTERQMLEEAQARLRAGASAVFITPANAGIDGKDRRYPALFDYCQDVGAPIICAPPAYHAGGDSTLGRPTTFGWTIRDFPRARVVFGAMGWTPELADGGELDLLEAIGRLPDACVDLSFALAPLAAAPSGPTRPTAEELAAAKLAALIGRIGAERVLFASGWPFADAKVALEGFWKLPLPDLDLILIGKENWGRLTS